MTIVDESKSIAEPLIRQFADSFHRPTRTSPSPVALYNQLAIQYANLVAERNAVQNSATLEHDRLLKAAASQAVPKNPKTNHNVGKTFSKQLIDLERSPLKVLITPEAIQHEAAALRESLALDRSPEIRAEASVLDDEFKAMWWWQRIPVPGTRAYTTSLPELIDLHDPGWLNTLNGALTPDEGCLLRPMPKWAYVKGIMPSLRKKSVLEVGCNNGFFSFAFADQLGADEVLGVEVSPQFLQGAEWISRRRTNKKVKFKSADILLDMTIPRHDVVFMSEVHGHFVDPFLGILRAVNLAKETLILDGAAGVGAGLEIDLGAGVDPETGRLTYHAWLLSDGLMMSYLYLCGVEPERVTRYVAPWQNHICYVIDTTNVENFRRENDFNACNTSFLGLDMRTATASRSEGSHS